MLISSTLLPRPSPGPLTVDHSNESFGSNLPSLNHHDRKVGYFFAQSGIKRIARSLSEVLIELALNSDSRASAHSFFSDVTPDCSGSGTNCFGSSSVLTETEGLTVAGIPVCRSWKNSKRPASPPSPMLPILL